MSLAFVNQNGTRRISTYASLSIPARKLSTDLKGDGYPPFRILWRIWLFSLKLMWTNYVCRQAQARYLSELYDVSLTFIPWLSMSLTWPFSADHLKMINDPVGVPGKCSVSSWIQFAGKTTTATCTGLVNRNPRIHILYTFHWNCCFLEKQHLISLLNVPRQLMAASHAAALECNAAY